MTLRMKSRDDIFNQYFRILKTAEDLLSCGIYSKHLFDIRIDRALSVLYIYAYNIDNTPTFDRENFSVCKKVKYRREIYMGLEKEEDYEEEMELVLTAKHHDLVDRLCKLFPEADISIESYVPVKNTWGVQIGHAPGVSYRRVTRSYADGPDLHDYTEEIAQILCNSGFKRASYYTSGCDDYHYEDYEIYYFAESCSFEYDY